jgi:hypothetical protein
VNNVLSTAQHQTILYLQMMQQDGIEMVILPYQYTAGVKKNYENLQDVSYLT